MLSVLIPTYKQEISPFITDLFNSAKKTEIVFEIIIIDDGSGIEFVNIDPSLLEIEEIKLIRLETNVGRAAIRNKLAHEAKYPNLLFLDADGALINSDFILQFIAYLNLYQVVSGGRIYSSNKPLHTNQFLHWKYGTVYESKSSRIRNKSPYLNFHSNNFLVKKDILLNYPFDKNLTSYGYEDTLWAKKLENERILILHIDNPVIHLGIEDNQIFLNKIGSSIDNLILISNTSYNLNLPLEIVYSRLNFFRLTKILNKIFELAKPNIIRNLLGRSPSLFLLQFYKLGLYSERK